MKWLNYTSLIKIETDKPPKSQNQKKTNKQTKQNETKIFNQTWESLFDCGGFSKKEI